MNLLLVTALLSFFSCKKDSTSNGKDNQLSDLPGYEVVQTVQCEGTYPMHLQGVVSNDNALFWSFTNQLVKTDKNGKLIKKIDVAYHHGDLTAYNGKIYVAVGFGTWNHINGLADSWIYEYNASDLQETKKYKVPELVYGAGGLVYHNEVFYVVGGLPDAVHENYIYEYDKNFNFKKRHVLESGHTNLGIQTIEFHDGKFWLGCYGNVKLIQLNEQLQILSKKKLDISEGIASQSPTELWIAGSDGDDKAGHTAKAILYKKK